jgi:hypothetical protein
MKEDKMDVTCNVHEEDDKPKRDRRQKLRKKQHGTARSMPWKIKQIFEEQYVIAWSRLNVLNTESSGEPLGSAKAGNLLTS